MLPYAPTWGPPPPSKQAQSLKAIYSVAAVKYTTRKGQFVQTTKLWLFKLYVFIPGSFCQKKQTVYKCNFIHQRLLNIRYL